MTYVEDIQPQDRGFAYGSVMGAVKPNAVQAENLSLAFGGTCVLDGVSFAIPKGRVILLRGENGSGKTTLLNVLTGFIRPDNGSLCFRFNGKALDAGKHSPEQLARRGVGRLWQDIRLFPTMTVLENVLAATPGLMRQNPFWALAAWPFARNEETHARERALRHLKMVGMADRATSSGDKLSVGQMKRVAIARLLQAEAELLLLDEPLAGLDRSASTELLHVLTRINEEQGKTMLIIEHQHERMATVCDETWFLAGGHLSSERGDA